MAGFYELAEKALQIERSGKKIIRLNVGDTNLPTPQCAIEAAAASLRRSKSGYGSAAGLPELRKRIAEREGCGVEQVVVGPGSKHLLYGLLSVLCEKGAEVAFPSPHWPAYGLACAQLGLRTRAVKTRLEDMWGFGPDALAGAKLAIICNPLNPTSTIYGERLVRDVISAAEKSGAHLILDEAYKGLSFRKIPRYEGETLVRVRSFSKEFNMEGWRLGYAVAPEAVAKRLISFNQITSTCVAPFVQEAGMACLEEEKKILEGNLRIWRSRADAAQKALGKAGFRFATPEAGIYVFATHSGIGESGDFALRLLESGVAVAPGTEFGGFRSFVRICVNRPEAELSEAIARMGKLA